MSYHNIAAQLENKPPDAFEPFPSLGAEPGSYQITSNIFQTGLGFGEPGVGSSLCSDRVSSSGQRLDSAGELGEALLAHDDAEQPFLARRTAAAGRTRSRGGPAVLESTPLPTEGPRDEAVRREQNARTEAAAAEGAGETPKADADSDDAGAAGETGEESPAGGGDVAEAPDAATETPDAAAAGTSPEEHPEELLERAVAAERSDQQSSGSPGGAALPGEATEAAEPAEGAAGASDESDAELSRPPSAAGTRREDGVRAQGVGEGTGRETPGGGETMIGSAPEGLTPRCEQVSGEMLPASGDGLQLESVRSKAAPPLPNVVLPVSGEQAPPRQASGGILLPSEAEVKPSPDQPFAAAAGSAEEKTASKPSTPTAEAVDDASGEAEHFMSFYRAVFPAAEDSPAKDRAAFGPPHLPACPSFTEVPSSCGDFDSAAWQEPSPAYSLHGAAHQRRSIAQRRLKTWRTSLLNGEFNWRPLPASYKIIT